MSAPVFGNDTGPAKGPTPVPSTSAGHMSTKPGGAPATTTPINGAPSK